MRGHRRSNDDAAIGFVAFLIAIVILMPFAGIYFLSKPDPNKKLGGAVLLVLGIIFWIIFGLNS